MRSLHFCNGLCQCFQLIFKDRLGETLYMVYEQVMAPGLLSEVSRGTVINKVPYFPLKLNESFLSDFRSQLRTTSKQLKVC